MSALAVPETPRPGDTIAGKYALLRPIGRGGMGLIFEATHLRLRQSVAIKFMVPDLVAKPDAVARFEREGRAASCLTSPYAARIFDVDVTPEGLPYIVSEFLHGRDLRLELDERRRLPVEEAVTYAIQVAAVMAEAHALGIVHRDLKPSNLFLANTASGRVVKVVDFGISKMDVAGDEMDITTTGTTLGSPRYMSPEQVQAKSVDRRADVWSLGVILFRALTDAYPFDGDTQLAFAVAMLNEKPRDVRDVVPEIPAGVAAAVAKALSRDVDERFATMRDLADALAPFAPPAMAALAESLTRDVAVNSARSPVSQMRPRAPSQVETMTAPVADLDVPIDVEPTEQATKGNWTQSGTQEPVVRRRRGWVVVAIGAAILVPAIGFGVVRGTGYEQAPKAAAEAPPAESNASIAAAPPSADPVASTTSASSASTTPTPPRPPKSVGTTRSAPAHTAAPPTPPPQGSSKNPHYL